MDAVELAKEAITRYAWEEAFDLLTRANAEDTLAPDGLELLAEAAWWSGKIDECLQARERAYAAHLEQDEITRAARTAIDMAYDHFARMDLTLGKAWLGRAESLLAQQSESPAHGYLTRIQGVVAYEGDGDLERGLELARRTHEIGRRFSVRDLEAYGLHDEGRILVALGQVPEGMALMDQAMVAAVGGDLGPMVTGKLYCNTIATCEQLSDYRRAGEWTEAAVRWSERVGHSSGFPGPCRVHRASIMRLRGRWTEAEEEARRACEELQYFVAFTAEAYYELGEIRLRMGDLGTAEAAFLRASELGRDPHPGLALLRLIEGKADSAANLIGQALASTPNALTEAHLLPAQVEICLARGDTAAARLAAEHLAAIATEYGTTALAAASAEALGRVLLAEQEPEKAAEHLRRAWRHWKEVDLPYEAAKARLALGQVLSTLGNRDAAELEVRAARRTFEELGARLDLRTATELFGGERELPVTRTLMFTDIVDSTPLVEAIGDEAWRLLSTWHDETLRSLFLLHGGEEANHAGDGFFVVFANATDAVQCAIAIQRSLEGHRRSHGFALQVRVGLHAGEVLEAEPGYKGRDVHVAARIAALGSGGEIIASRQTIENLKGVRASDPTPAALKGVTDQIEVVQISWRDAA